MTKELLHKEWQDLVSKERTLYQNLEDLSDEKRLLQRFEEEATEKTREGIYHVTQLLDRAKNKEDFYQRQSLLDTFSHQAKVLDDGFQNRRDAVRRKEQKLYQDLEETQSAKRKAYDKIEEAKRGDKEARW